MDYSVRARIIAAGFRRVVGLVGILSWGLNDAARLMKTEPRNKAFQGRYTSLRPFF